MSVGYYYGLFDAYKLAPEATFRWSKSRISTASLIQFGERTSLDFLGFGGKRPKNK
jgi:hypothetical protein